MSYAVDERIDEFARAFAGILHRLVEEKDAQQDESNQDSEERTKVLR